MNILYNYIRHVFFGIFILTSLTACSQSSDAPDTTSGAQSGDTTTTTDTTMLQKSLQGSGLYSYIASDYYKFIYFTQLYTLDNQLYTKYYDYDFNENSNLLELQPHQSYTSQRYIVKNSQWTKVDEDYTWSSNYSFNANGSLITTNIDGDYKSTVTKETTLDGLNIKTIVNDEIKSIISDTVLFSTGAYMLNVNVENITKRRLYLNIHDTYEADGNYGTFDSIDALKTYYAKDNSSHNYIKYGIDSSYDAQFGLDGTIYFYDTDHIELPLHGSLELKTIDGANFYAVNVPSDYDLSLYIGKVILAVVDGSVKNGYWNENYQGSWPLQMFNQTAMQDIKDAVEQGFQQ